LSYWLHNPSNGYIAYLETTNGSPFRVLSGGNASAVFTTISCTGAVPITGNIANLLARNLDAAQAFRVASSLNAGAQIAYFLAGFAYTFLCPLDGSREFMYKFDAAPVGSANIDLLGYYFER